MYFLHKSNKRTFVLALHQSISPFFCVSESIHVATKILPKFSYCYDFFFKASEQIEVFKCNLNSLKMGWQGIFSPVLKTPWIANCGSPNHKSIEIAQTLNSVVVITYITISNQRNREVFFQLIYGIPVSQSFESLVVCSTTVSYTHLTLPTNREV